MSFSNKFTSQEISNTAKKSSLQIVEEEKMDFLDVDRTIPGQNFVCMSFLSPESAIKERYLWYVSEFLSDLVKKVKKPDNISELEYKTKLHSVIQKKISYNSIKNLWEDFLFTENKRLSALYDEKNNFQTSTRGIKIRGTYDTYREAKNRSNTISKTDKNHNVYIGQVGYWLPWDPSPNEVSDQQYQEKELNTLMKGYRENKLSSDEFFYKRKEEKMKDALQKNKKSKLIQEKKKEKLNKVRKIINKKDELFNKKKSEDKKNVETPVETPVETSVETPVETPVEISSFGNMQLTSENMSVFSSEDPWSQRTKLN